MSAAARAGIRGWRDGIPVGIVRLAARRLPSAIRADLRDEWIAELLQILHVFPAPAPSQPMPGLRFAVGLLFAAPRVGRALVGAGPKASRASRSQGPERINPAGAALGFPKTAYSEMENIRWIYLRSGVHAPQQRRRPLL